MPRPLGPVAALVVLLGVLTAPLAASAQNAERDQREAVATAEEIFRLAEDRKFNAMFDRIHPDAHAVVPRAAAVGAFEEIYGAAQAGQFTILGVELVEWTWPVTGKTYRNAAEVRYELPYVEDGVRKIVEAPMYLVDSGGEWRWFFGADRDFVETAIERFGGASGAPLTEGNLLENVVNDLDDFYTDVFGYTDSPYAYQTPGVVVVPPDEAVQTECGPAQSGFWAFYCPLDKTIYLDSGLLGQLQQRADFAVAFVIGHEWAHHVQTTVGIERVDPGEQPETVNDLYSIELELMADCFTGLWALDVDTRGQLEADDIDEAVQFTIEYLGDPEYIDQYDPQAHGTDQQRSESFLTGYEGGFEGCNVTV